MEPATFCLGCGTQEEALYGPVPGTKEDFLCLGCAEQWAAEHPQEFRAATRVGASGQYRPAGAELFEGEVQLGDVVERIWVLEFGSLLDVPCEHGHVDALNRTVQTWN